MKKYIEQNYSEYLSLLKQLVAINTVYDNAEGIHTALEFCKNHFSRYLNNYDIYFDSRGNNLYYSRY